MIENKIYEITEIFPGAFASDEVTLFLATVGGSVVATVRAEVTENGFKPTEEEIFLNDYFNGQQS